MSECLHDDIDKDGTCMDCGECYIKPAKWQDVILVRKYKTEGDVRKLCYFKKYLDYFYGRTTVKISNKNLYKISILSVNLYSESFTHKQLIDVLIKLKLYKYIKHSMIIYDMCGTSTITEPETMLYEHYLIFMWEQLYKQFKTIYYDMYFISGKFIVSKLLKELDIDSPCYFKNLNTYQKHSDIYNRIRPLVQWDYLKYSNYSINRAVLTDRIIRNPI